jgi:hypothetical protein
VGLELWELGMKKQGKRIIKKKRKEKKRKEDHENWEDNGGNLEEEDRKFGRTGKRKSSECGPWKSLESKLVRDKTQEKRGEKK